MNGELQREYLEAMRQREPKKYGTRPSSYVEKVQAHFIDGPLEGTSRELPKNCTLWSVGANNGGIITYIRDDMLSLDGDPSAIVFTCGKA